MGVTNYTCLSDIIIGERLLGGPRTNYAIDAVGSVTGTLNSTLQNSYSFKPYGAELGKSGGGADPEFLWMGSQGYKTTARAFVTHYVRARTYSCQLGRFVQKAPSDAVAAGEQPYAYAFCDPVTESDPTGNDPCTGNVSVSGRCPASGKPPCETYKAGPCAYFLYVGLAGDNEGGAICCNYKVYNCVWNSNVPKHPRPNQAIIDCIQAHENSHRPEVDCSKTLFDWAPPSAASQGEQADECKAYTIEIACYAAARHKDCSKLKGAARQKCINYYKWWICNNACNIMSGTPPNGYQCPTMPAECKGC